MTRRTLAAATIIAASLATTAAALQQKARPAALTPLPPKVADVAAPLPLTAVRLTGGPLKHAQDLDRAYLLKLEPDRMLAFYRERAGLQKKAEPYGGWDGDKRNLTGHIAGHYLSAVSLMYAATGDPAFKQRADYIVDELKAVQDRQGDGYVFALMDGKKNFQDVSNGIIKSSGFDLNGMWSPWYVLHKTYAGLRDAYRYTGNRTALAIEIRAAQWAESILAKLDDAQTQKMLNTEFGGMNEVLADLYADTGDRRWLDLSYHFEYRAVVDPWKEHEDDLNGLHGNATIPKAIGSLARFIYTGDLNDGFAASFFWDRVAKHHSFATGGDGKDEYFRQADRLSTIIDGRTAESCNVYNMLKLTRDLFALRPDAEYAEFQERALFNHVLGSIDPADGSTCYMVPVGRAVRREYQNMAQSFTCCVGTGMENHALHGDGVYYTGPDRLWVNIYAPSTAEWAAEGVKLALETSFPEGDEVKLTLTPRAAKAFTLALRRPRWAGQGFTVKVNGESVANLAEPGAYVELKRTWKPGDTVALVLPKALHLEPLVDDPSVTAIMWGPLVLAGDLGPEPPRGQGRGAAGGGGGGRQQPSVDVPALVTASRNPSDWLKPIADRPGEFRTDGVGKDRDLDLVPFYRLHRHVYTGYFDLYTPAEWAKKSAEIAAERERQKQLEAATVAFLQPGEMQPERDFNQQGENTGVARLNQRTGRTGRGWFSFDMPIDPSKANVLVATYHSDSRRPRTFDILVDGQSIAQERFDVSSENRFLDREYAIPAALVQGKQKVTVRFQATGGNDIAAVFGLRMIRR
ncbi:MAG TPA: beta-L-arabinofuranosidase domain-containing protein [Vicinamibacterales bacterium]|nr:beta-L-arabinofuranosidase domain-containing protein [Vicinamibacterales bacterium]